MLVLALGNAVSTKRDMPKPLNLTYYTLSQQPGNGGKFKGRTPETAPWMDPKCTIVSMTTWGFRKSGFTLGRSYSV